MRTLTLRAFILTVFAAAQLWVSSSQAKIEVLFHPTDPTLEKVGAWLSEAHDSIDIAMYSMDTSSASPVIKSLSDPAFQARLKSGDVTIRMIFEGYGKPADNAKKMADLEALGVDVRFLKSGKKVHHKFAVIDSGTADARVITGSANWSLSSYRGYDENILFMDQEPEANAGYEVEFERLWNGGEEFGATVTHPARLLPDLSGAPDRMDTHFNSPRVLEKNQSPEHVLTAQVVRLIDQAKSEIEIATTRIRLQPVLESLKAAAARGVKIRALISQDDFHDLWKRSDFLLNQPGLELRIKFYNLKPSQYISAQMHNKFMVVDREIIETGSFNWSESSEDGHVENILELKNDGAAEVLPSYLSRFDFMWERGRSEFEAFKASLAQKKQAGELPTCGFTPMSLTYDEVRELLKLAPKCGASYTPAP